MAKLQKNLYSRKGAGIYLKMIFRDGFFHADPHPGIFLVMKDGRIGLLDYGMVGTNNSINRINLFQLMYGIIKNDLDLVIDALYDLGIYIKPEREKFFEQRTGDTIFLLLYATFEGS